MICQPGEALGFDEMIAFLKDQRQKYLLREAIARLLGQKALIR